VDHDLERLDLLHHLGVGIFQLTYNTRSLLGDGCAERTDSGLSRLGVAAIKRMNELGMIVDASHCGRATSLDAIALSDRPISFTHTGCRAVFDHPRNKTDDELRALGERDGYVGIYTIPWALTDDDQFGMGPFLDHIDHAVGVAGIGRVGIGTDWGAPSPEFPDALRASLFESIVGGSLQAAGSSRPKPRALGELSSYRQWRQITRGLVSRGYSDDEVRGIIGGNFLQFFRRISGQGDEAAAIAGSARTAAHG
jgi:membrane dipeptidase